MWLWKKEQDIHFFVYDEREAMKKLSKMSGIASVERNVPDIEAKILENVIPKLAEKIENSKVKYVVIAPLGVLWDKKVKVNATIGFSLGIALYQRKPRFLSKEEVVDYVPYEYEPLSKIEKTEIR